MKQTLFYSNQWFKNKVWVFWEGHKIWKNLCRTFDKSVVFCAPNSVLVKKSTKNSKNKCGQVVLYKLYHKEKFSVVYRRIKIWVPKFPHPYFYKTYQLVYISTSKFEFIFNLKNQRTDGLYRLTVLTGQLLSSQDFVYILHL